MDIEINKEAYDEFIVLDEDNNPITGLIDGDFTRKLFDPDDLEVANISAGISVSITEIGNGFYRVSFIPNKLGNWILVVYNSTYFPFGKGASYSCIEYSNADLGQALDRILGLSQENYRIFNPVYDNRNNLLRGTIKIYSSALDVDTDTNSIAQYEISSTYDNKNRMTGYKVKKL
jgi:hypothetical protein